MKSSSLLSHLIGSSTPYCRITYIWIEQIRVHRRCATRWRIFGYACIQYRLFDVTSFQCTVNPLRIQFIFVHGGSGFDTLFNSTCRYRYIFIACLLSPASPTSEKSPSLTSRILSLYLLRMSIGRSKLRSTSTMSQLPPGFDPANVPLLPPLTGLTSNFINPPSLAHVAEGVGGSLIAIETLLLCFRTWSNIKTFGKLRLEDCTKLCLNFGYLIYTNLS